MPTYRVEVIHHLREHLTISVTAESRSLLESKQAAIYAQACELNGWKLEDSAGLLSESGQIIVLDEEDGNYDTPADASMLVTDQDVSLLDPGLRPSRDKIAEILLRNSSKCLDDDDEREDLLRQILEALS